MDDLTNRDINDSANHRAEYIASVLSSNLISIKEILEAAHRTSNNKVEYIASALSKDLSSLQEALAAIHETLMEKEINIEIDNGDISKVVNSLQDALEAFGQTAITKQASTIQAMLDAHFEATANLVDTQAKSIEANTKSFNDRMSSLERVIEKSVDQLVLAQTAPRTLTRDKNGEATGLVVTGKKKDGLFD